MSVSGITFSGLASGLDTQAIIQALLAVEQRPITLLEQNKKDYKSQLSLFGDLETKIGALRDAADKLRKSSSFLDFKATLDQSEYMTATAGSGATAGTYTVSVDKLAQAQSSQSDSYSSGTDPEIAGSNSSRLEFTIDGTKYDVDLQNATYSLEEIATAINSQGFGVQAQVAEVATGDFRLVVTGEVGETNAISIKGFGTGGVKNLGKDLNDNELQAAQDAELTINGLTYKRDSNSISDVIQGVTMNLTSSNGAAGSPDFQLTVSADAEATGAKIQKFVDAYNGIVDFVAAQSVLDEDGNPTSPLFGDSTLRSVRSTLRSLLGSQATTGNEAYSLASLVGIATDREGKLTFTQSEFEEAVADDEDAVIALFANTTNGLAHTIYNQADDYLDTVDGLLVARKNGFNTRIKNADDRIEAATRRLLQTQLALEQKFANLEVLLNQLQSQGAALSGIPASFSTS